MRILESIILGILAACGALLTETIFSLFFDIFINQNIHNIYTDTISSPSFKITSSFIALAILAIILEECFKYIIIVKKVDAYSMNRKLLLNSLFVGFGFFLVEVLLIFGKLNFQFKNIMPNLQNIAEIGFIHITTAGYIGYIVAIKNPKKINTLFIAIFGAAFFHSAYNILIIFQNSYLTPVKYTLFIILTILTLANILRINKKFAY